MLDRVVLLTDASQTLTEQRRTSIVFHRFFGRRRADVTRGCPLASPSTKRAMGVG